MLKHRVIPVLLLNDVDLVKTKKFKNPSYIGDPINAIRIFNDKEVDELVVIDISASKKGVDPNYALIEEFAGECFMPLTYGGGIQNLDQAEKLFKLGIEKICIHSAALNNIGIISKLKDRFGSSSIVVSVDIYRDLFNRPKLFNSVSRKKSPRDWLEYISNVQKAGAGEILLNSVSKDGTLDGPDLELIKIASKCLKIPLISVGGISSLHDIKRAVECGSDAVAAGAFFVYHGQHRAVLISYPNYSELEALFRA